MSSSDHDIESEQNKQQDQTPPIREHYDCTIIGDCQPYFQNLALPFLSQYPEYPRGERLPLRTCLKDPPPTNNTLIKLHFRTLGRILHPDKYSGYVGKSGPPPKSFLFFESQHPFDPNNPTLETPTTSPQKALHLVNLARQTLLDPFLRYEYEYENDCTGILRQFSMSADECNRAKENGNPYIRNGWMDVKEREFKGWGRKPWFWEYEYGFGETGLLAVRGGYGWMESFWIQFFPNFGEKWGFIGGEKMREGREPIDIKNVKIGGFGGDGVGVGVGETIVNVGHYYIDNYLPSLFSDWIWRTCEDFRKGRGYGLIGHYEIDPRSSKKIWKGSNGEWLALREGEMAGLGSRMSRMIGTSPMFVNTSSSTIGGHCEGRIWWAWIPASAGGSVSNLGIGRLAGSGVDSIQGRNLTELPWSHRYHNSNTNKYRLQSKEINVDEVFDSEVIEFLIALHDFVVAVSIFLFSIWGCRRFKRWWQGIGMGKEKENEKEENGKEMGMMNAAPKVFGKPSPERKLQYHSHDWNSEGNRTSRIVEGDEINDGSESAESYESS